MTEAMSRREIEDILTSIRKLVSHDPANALAPKPQPDREGSTMGKLILTSALRVTDAPMSQHAPHMPEAAPRDPLTSDVSEISEASDVWPTDSMLDEHISGNSHDAAMAPVYNRFDPETSASLLSRITRSAGTGAEASAAPQIATGHAGNIDAAPNVIPAALADAQDWLDDADIPLPAATPPDETRSDTDFALEETLARLEAMLSGEKPSAAPTTMTNSAAETATTSSPDMPKAALDTSEATQATAPDTDDAAMIDEAMLYQLVANIVRQELQGELGEKITRAIRKLVRAEVARELQLRNM